MNDDSRAFTFSSVNRGSDIKVWFKLKGNVKIHISGLIYCLSGKMFFIWHIFLVWCETWNNDTFFKMPIFIEGKLESMWSDITESELCFSSAAALSGPLCLFMSRHIYYVLDKTNKMPNHEIPAEMHICQCQRVYVFSFLELFYRPCFDHFQRRCRQENNRE